MTTILILAHAPLASALKVVAEHNYADTKATLLAVDVQPDQDAAQAAAAARALLLPHRGTPTLIFADVVGATPYNAALLLLDTPQVRLVAGINVPMLWRTLCYCANTSIDELVECAVTGAKHGVIPVASSRPHEQTQRTAPNDQAGRHDQQ